MRYISLIVVLCSCLLAGQLSAESLFIKGNPEFKEVSNQEMRPQFTSLIRQVSQSVVNIAVKPRAGLGKVSKSKKGKRNNGTLRSVGSGFIASKDGYVVTNYHVIETADEIVVRLLDDRHEYEAELIGQDSKTDLALLKIDLNGKEVEPVYIGDSDGVEVGEWVVAIGNQFQLGQTVTAGIVSAKSRKVPNRPMSSYDNFIQTDASINPGSSGGPLFNIRGEVIGINTAIFSPGRGPLFGGTGFNIGIGFAIPMNLASSVLEQIKESGSVTRGGLGVIIQHIDTKMSEALGYEDQVGALVADVIEGSPADQAGFRVKDVIVQYNDDPVKDHDDLPLMVAGTRIGTQVTVTVLRGGKKVALTPVIQDLSKMDFPGGKEEEVKEELPEYNNLGLMVQNLTPKKAKEYGIAAGSGVLVDQVEPESAAFIAGLTKGDVITELDGMQVNDAKTFDKIADSLTAEEPALIVFRRKEGGRLTTITPLEEEKEEEAVEEPAGQEG